MYVLLTIGSFFTMVIVYIALTAIIPLENEMIEEDTKFNKEKNNSFLGISLIILGLILLANNFLPLYFPGILSTIRYYSRRLLEFWPVLFIVLGIYLLIDKNK